MIAREPAAADEAEERLDVAEDRGVHERLRLRRVEEPVLVHRCILVDAGASVPVRPLPELPAGGVDVGPPVAPDRGGEPAGGEPIGERPDVGRGGRPAAEAGGGVERDEVHVGAERPERARSSASSSASSGRVVHALDARVLERDPATVAARDRVRGVDDLAQRVAAR